VAKADNSHTPVTWETLQEVLPLVLKICISPSEAGPWLAGLIADKLVRRRWQKVRPASTSAAELELFWRAPQDALDQLPTLDFVDNSARKLVTFPGEMMPCPVILSGFQVVREDIAAQQPGVEAELAQSQQSITLNVAQAMIGEVSFATSVTRTARRMMALAAVLLRRPAPPAKASVQAPTSKRLWRKGEELDWLLEKKEQNPLAGLYGEKTEWGRKRLKEGRTEFADGEFPWETADSIVTKLNDLIAGRLVRDPDTGRVVRRNKK
jgi:hypothetical protein